jgi:hypothetical protein
VDDESDEIHLTDADFFALAVPAAGEPEVLPRHLSDCQSCSRALQEWKVSVRELAEEDADAINRRSPDQWNAAADATMARIRRAAKPAARHRSLRWAIGIAASLLILALAIPRHGVPRTSAARSTEASDLSAADREDDQLLRDVAYLAQGDDTGSGLLLEDSL